MRAAVPHAEPVRPTVAAAREQAADPAEDEEPADAKDDEIEVRQHRGARDAQRDRGDGEHDDLVVQVDQPFLADEDLHRHCERQERQHRERRQCRHPKRRPAGRGRQRLGERDGRQQARDTEDLKERQGAPAEPPGVPGDCHDSPAATSIRRAWPRTSAPSPSSAAADSSSDRSEPSRTGPSSASR